MQNQYGTDQFQPKSRVVKLEDTNGDGKMEKRTVFADSLLLPRSIIALHDRILVRMSNDSTIWAFFDDNNDGVADRKEIALQGEPEGANIEHQDNSLLWNADNKIYETGRSLFFKEGELKLDKNLQRYGQWGLARDEVGRIYGSHNSLPVKDWHNLAGYSNITPPLEEAIKDAHFICTIDDATDPGTQVTATGGQTLLRSSQFGRYSNSYVIPDPVRRMVKILSFEERNGVRVAIPHPDFKETEFIRSPDAYFRPVWADIGPDGGLYIADMSRGIIQEAQWFPTEQTKDPNPRWLARYYRSKDWGMLEINQRGRIYRLVPENKDLLDPRPAFSSKTSSELVEYLGHENGWWRDTAHKLIICREDRTAIPDLRKTLTSNSALARMLSLRCLQAFGNLKPEDVIAALKDDDENVRTTAVAVAEAMVSQYPQLESVISQLTQDTSSTVISQLYVSLRDLRTTFAVKTLKDLVSKNVTNASVILLNEASERLPGHLEAYRPGYTLYSGLCTECHGDGEKGLGIDGVLMAPIFAGNHRIRDPKYLIRVMLKGLQGPLGPDENYSAGVMPPLEGMYKDDQIALIANYIGFRWANWQTPVTPENVAEWRACTNERLTPYTLEDLKGDK